MVKKIAAVAMLAMSLVGASGCSYAGIAVAPNGVVYVARNDMLLLGLLRGVYACVPNGAALNCSQAGAP